MKIIGVNRKFASQILGVQVNSDQYQLLKCEIEKCMYFSYYFYKNAKTSGDHNCLNRELP